MDGAEIKQSIICELSKLPAYKPNTTGIWHVVRCPYCGDSRNHSHGHFAIKIDCNEPDSAMGYHCLRCDEHGLLTDDVLEDLGVSFSLREKQKLKLLNRKSAKHNKLTDTCIEDNAVVNYTPNPQMISHKLNYINNRLGTNFDAMEAARLSMVPNIMDFLVANNIKGVNKSYRQLKFYDINYTGFMTYNRNHVVLRDISGSASLRWDKVILNERDIDPHTFYSIPNGIDLLYTEPINIRISEGIMDILSVYANMNDKDLQGNYYYAVCGFGYTSILKNIIRLGMNTNLNVHLYADNDKPDYKIIPPIERAGLMNWIDHLYIHRNAYPGEKDYGVPKEKIKDSVKRVK